MSFSLKYKHVFLSFLQEYFKSNPYASHTWDKDITKTDIIIADKHSIEKGSAFLKPAIILNRGPLSWSGTFRGEGMPRSQKLVDWGGPNMIYEDIVRGTLTFHITSKTEWMADELANEIFMLFTAFKQELKAKGIHEITQLTISQNQLIKAGSTIELTGVTISLGFVAHERVSKNQYYYLLKAQTLPVGETEWQDLKEGVHFNVTPEATGIQLLYTPQNGDTFKASYTEALTLEEKINQTLTVDPDSNTLYHIPDGDYIWGYYKIVNFINITDMESSTETQV